MARNINFFDGAESSTEPTLGNIDTTNIVSYADDSSYEADNAGSPAEGNIYYNTTVDKIKYYSDGAWRIVLDISSTQTLTNKTISGASNTLTNLDADEVVVDAIAGLTATDAQAAFAEHQTELTDHESRISTNETDIGNNTTAISGKIDSSEKGANNGVATLDGSGKVPAAQLAASVMQFQGFFDPGTATFTDGAGDAGDVYEATAAGSYDAGSGSITYAIGDWAVHDGSVFGKSINGYEVVSVNTQTGSVVLDTDDIAEGSTNEYYTDTKADARANVQIAAASIGDLSDVDLTTPPTDTQILAFDSGSGDFLPADAASAVSSVAGTATISHSLSSGTGGGTFTSGAWQTRVLNTIAEIGPSFTSLSSNQFTLDPGTYIINWSALGYRCNIHQSKLRNTTDSTEVLGVTNTDVSTTAAGSSSNGYATLTIASAKTFEIQQRCSTTRSADGFGNPGSFGTNEVYAVVEIQKIELGAGGGGGDEWGDPVDANIIPDTTATRDLGSSTKAFQSLWAGTLKEPGSSTTMIDLAAQQFNSGNGSLMIDISNAALFEVHTPNMVIEENAAFQIAHQHGNRDITIQTSTNTNADTGDVILRSRSATGTGTGGKIRLETENTSNSTTSGDIDATTGNNTSTGTTGDFNFSTGNATTGNSGSINLTTGTAGSARGEITLSALAVNAPVQTSDPSTTTGGAVYYNSTTGKLRVYNDVLAQWDDLN